MIISFDPGTVNLGFSITKQRNDEIVKTGILVIKSRTKTQMLKKLMGELDRLYSFVLSKGTLKYVIIEKQVPKNVKMREIEVAISSFFLTMNNVHQREHENIIYDARLKFRTNVQGFEFNLLKRGSAAYNRRKSEAQRCVEFLYGVRFVRDISDALLQAYCFNHST